MSNAKISFFCYLLGVLCGFIFGSSLGRDLSVIVGKVIFALAILITVVYWRRLESTAHVSYVESWPSLRQRGKLRFIIMKYILLRGGIFAVVFIGPVWITLGLSIVDNGYLVMIILLLVIITIYLGNEQWNNCQRDHEAWSLRQRAEVERDATSLTN